MRFTVRPGTDPVAVADGALLQLLGLPSGGIVKVGRSHVPVRPASVPGNDLQLGPEALANAGVVIGAIVDVIRAIPPDASRVDFAELPIGGRVVLHALQGRPVTAGDRLTVPASFRTDGGPDVTLTVKDVLPGPCAIIRGSTAVQVAGAGPASSEAEAVRDEPAPLTTGAALLAGLEAERDLLAGWFALLTKTAASGAWGLPAVAGVVVEGPAGCGRSELVAAAAADAGAEVVTVELTSVFKPERLLDRLSASLDKASAPAVVFIDHIDTAIGPDGLSTFRTQYLAVVRWFLDTISQRPGLCCALGLDRASTLDPSLRASNLLPRTLSLPPPDLERRQLLFTAALASVPTREVDAGRLAALSAGFSGADIMAAVLQASAMVANTGGPVTAEIAEEAVRGTAPSLGSVPIGEVSGVGFDKVANLSEVKQRLTEAVIWPLKEPDRFLRLGIEPPRGILLYGPPGTGKTFVVRALANEAGAAFYSVKGAELLDKYVGESERAVRDVFARARGTAPSLIFFDEFDALAPVRGRSTTTVSDSVVAALLTEIDGMSERGQVAVIAATNRRELIDPALLRAGRFETHVYLGLPDVEARRAMLDINDVPLAEDIDLDELATLTEGLSFADIAGLLREAALAALRSDGSATMVRREHLDAALAHVRAQRQGDGGEDPPGGVGVPPPLGA